MKRSRLLAGTALPSPRIFGLAVPEAQDQPDVDLPYDGPVTVEELQAHLPPEPSRADRRRNRVAVVVHGPVTSATDGKVKHPVTFHKRRRRQRHG